MVFTIASRQYNATSNVDVRRSNSRSWEGSHLYRTLGSERSQGIEMVGGNAL